jgi:hypothetical protein
MQEKETGPAKIKSELKLQSFSKLEENKSLFLGSEREMTPYDKIKSILSSGRKVFNIGQAQELLDLIDQIKEDPSKIDANVDNFLEEFALVELFNRKGNLVGFIPFQEVDGMNYELELAYNKSTGEKEFVARFGGQPLVMKESVDMATAEGAAEAVVAEEEDDLSIDEAKARGEGLKRTRMAKFLEAHGAALKDKPLEPAVSERVTASSSREELHSSTDLSSTLQEVAFDIGKKVRGLGGFSPLSSVKTGGVEAKDTFTLSAPSVPSAKIKGVARE